MPQKYIEFSEVAGKKVKNVTLYTTASFHAIAIRFEDASIFNIDLEPGFTARVDYSDWKSGDSSVIRRLPPIVSETCTITQKRKQRPKSS
jgi:hypothetical protein